MSDTIFNRTAERAVLAECIRNNEFIALLQQSVPESCYFGLAKHILLYNIITTLDDSYDSFDRYIVEQYIYDNELQDTLSKDALSKIIATTSTKQILSDHIESIVSDYKRRTISQNTEKAQLLLQSPKKEDMEDAILLLNEATMLMASTQKTTTEDVFDIIIESVGSILGDIDIFPSDIVVRDGSLIVIAARPAMGKTTYVLNMAWILVGLGYNVLTFSLEMLKEDLKIRMVQSTLRVEQSEALEKQYEFNKLQSRVKGRLLIEDSVHDISRIIPIIKSKNKIRKLDFVVIDYLQLVEFSKYDSNDNKRVSYISRELKKLALQTGIKIFVLSQLNRGLESRDDKRPRLGDLRDSGAIEQDADIVLGLYQPGQYYKINPATNKPYDGETELIVLKNRRGALLTVPLWFDKVHVLFEKDNEGSDVDNIIKQMEENEKPKTKKKKEK